LRGFLNIVFGLMVAGLTIIALTPAIVLSMEVYQDPLVLGLLCYIDAKNGSNILRIEAWYRGSLRISNVTIEVYVNNTRAALETRQEISRYRNASVEVVIPTVFKAGDVLISISAVLQGLYSMKVVSRVCSY